MNSKDLAAVVEANSRLNKSESNAVVKALLKAMRDAVLDGQLVKLRLVGTIGQGRRNRRNVSGLSNGARPQQHRPKVRFLPSRGLMERLEATKDVEK